MPELHFSEPDYAKLAALIDHPGFRELERFLRRRQSLAAMKLLKGEVGTLEEVRAIQAEYRAIDALIAAIYEAVERGKKG